MTNNVMNKNTQTDSAKAAAFEDMKVLSTEELCGLDDRSHFQANCAICGVFVLLSVVAVYVMFAFPQAGY